MLKRVLKRKEEEEEIILKNVNTWLHVFQDFLLKNYEQGTRV
jgi:hypothetical protein